MKLESPLGEGTWRILHNHKASKHVKHSECNFESRSTFVVVHIERVRNVYGQGMNWPVLVLSVRTWVVLKCSYIELFVLIMHGCIQLVPVGHHSVPCIHLL